MNFGLLNLKNQCPATYTMTLDHFGYVPELPGHSKCPFSDPNFGILKLQDGLRDFLKLHEL